MKKDKIDDIIADGKWRIPDVVRKIRKEKKKTAYIAIGRPRPDDDPRGDWICPIQIENFMSGVKNVHGIGPLDALLNAMNLLRSFFDMNTAVHLEPIKAKTASKSSVRRGSRAAADLSRWSKRNG